MLVRVLMTFMCENDFKRRNITRVLAACQSSSGQKHLAAGNRFDLLARTMKKSITWVALLLCLTPLVGHAQEAAWEIESLSPQNEFVYDLNSGSGVGTNGVIIRYAGAVLTADRVSLNQNTGEATAAGHVRIQRDDQVWVGDRIAYNFKTLKMSAEEFRTGKPPVFGQGHMLMGDRTSQDYVATDAMVTADDYSDPAITVRARKLRIVSGKYFEAYDALLYLKGVPVFYLPYFKRNFDERANNFNLTPGYRSRYGPFVLGSYNWYLREELDGTVHVDYRLKRGLGAGPDVNYHLDRWGEGSVRYYYLRDEEPNLDNLTGEVIPSDRHRLYFDHLGEPYTNLTIRSQVRYQSDANVNRDFFDSDYRDNPQPSTYAEVNKFWDNFSLDIYAQPRVNEFLENVERLPDARLTGYRQQLWNTPLYYQSESSFAYLRRRFAESNDVPADLNYAAARADTYHQLLLPYTAFGWLNLTPRAGGRFTYYSDDSGLGGTNTSESRVVFDTGMEVSFKMSRLWPAAQSKLLAVDGLRHIVEPSVNYVYVPKPTRQPDELPQFDYLIPSLRLRPIDFPSMNSIDAIDSESTLRFGLRNTFQTKREDDLVALLDWQLMADLRLDRQAGESRLSNVYSDLMFAPRNWVTLESEVQMDAEEGEVPLAFHTLTLTPNDTWSWSLSHRYLRSDSTFGLGNNVIGNSIYYRINENWGVRLAHYFEARDGHMEEQYYSLYRDFRAWTSALTFRVRNPRVGREDFVVALTFSLKVRPRFGLGEDIARPFRLTGG